jgi:hypothetical protein
MYRPCERATAEECLEAALAEIEAGPRPPEPDGFEGEELEPDELEAPLLPEEPPQVTASGRRKRRGGLLGFLRR